MSRREVGDLWIPVAAHGGVHHVQPNQKNLKDVVLIRDSRIGTTSYFEV